MVTSRSFLGFAFALSTCVPFAYSQAAPPQSVTAKDQKTPAATPPPVDVDGWGRPVTPPAKGQKSSPAPRHDISGTWEPAGGPLDGVQFNGSKAFQEDGKADREPPYTALGRELWQHNKPS